MKNKTVKQERKSVKPKTRLNREKRIKVTNSSIMNESDDSTDSAAIKWIIGDNFMTINLTT